MVTSKFESPIAEGGQRLAGCGSAVQRNAVCDFFLAVQFYREAKAVSLPHYLKDQLRRAALSIALNISEGTGKSSMRDRARFFEIALGSIRECQAILDIESDAFTPAQRDLLDHVAASTYQLVRNSRR